MKVKSTFNPLESYRHLCLANSATTHYIPLITNGASGFATIAMPK